MLNYGLSLKPAHELSFSHRDGIVRECESVNITYQVLRLFDCLPVSARQPGVGACRRSRGHSSPPPSCWPASPLSGTKCPQTNSGTEQGYSKREVVPPEDFFVKCIRHSQLPLSNNSVTVNLSYVYLCHIIWLELRFIYWSWIMMILIFGTNIDSFICKLVRNMTPIGSRALALPQWRGPAPLWSCWSVWRRWRGRRRWRGTSVPCRRRTRGCTAGGTSPKTCW